MLETLKKGIEENWPVSKYAQHLEKADRGILDKFFVVYDPITKDEWYHTPFSYACMHGRLDICKLLASKKDGIKSFFGKGATLALAVLHGQFHVADWLQEVFKTDCSFSESYALRLSVRFQRLDSVKYALDHNADIHILNDFCLRTAARHGFEEIVSCLLDHGADPNARDSEGTVLQSLTSLGLYRLAAKAVFCGADIDGLPEPELQKLQSYLVSIKLAKKKTL